MNFKYELKVNNPIDMWEGVPGMGLFCAPIFCLMGLVSFQRGDVIGVVVCFLFAIALCIFGCVGFWKTRSFYRINGHCEVPDSLYAIFYRFVKAYPNTGEVLKVFINDNGTITWNDVDQLADAMVVAKGTGKENLMGELHTER